MMVADQERKHFFDKPDNVRWLLRIFYGCCVALVAVELFVHRHLAHPFEGLFGFYAAYGLISCVVLVLLAKVMRVGLMRKEDYYDDG